MIVLSLDTALDACSVAVCEDDRTMAARSEAMTRGHQERLAPLAAEAMAQAGLAFGRLHRIAVTVGPGSFTGLRVGLAFAKSLSLALDIPCVGVGTLEALAAGEGGGLVIAAIDARRDQLYLQAFRDGEPLIEPLNLPVEAARARGLSLGAGPATPVAGSGAALLGIGAATGADRVDPVALARLGTRRTPGERRPAPLYLRAPDAKTIAERAALQALRAP